MNYISTHIAFVETIDSLKNEFETDNSNDVIICGSHGLSKTEDIEKYKEKYSRVILFNQEPLLAKQKNWVHQRYLEWINKADEVWDYDEQNIEFLSKYSNNVKLHTLKPYKKWPEKSNKDIDILFYGSLNEHRMKLLNHLKTKYNVVICNGVFGDDLDKYILRSKILLNIHYYYECAMQEQARMIRWIGAPCRIISEKSHKNYMGIEEMSYEDLFNL